MAKIHCKSDFKLTLGMRQGDKPAPFPDCDWEAEFWTGNRTRKYRASCIGGECVNCRRNSDGIVTVIFDNHRMGAGTLRWEPHFYFPDSDFPDYVRDLYDKYSLGVELVDGHGDDSASAEATALLPYIKGERGERGPKGDKGDKGDTGDGFTSEQSDKLDALPTAEKLNGEIEDAKIDLFRKLWIDACKSVCRKNVTYGGVNADGLPVLYDEVLTWDEAIHIYNISHKSPMHLMTQHAYIHGDKLGRFFLPLRVTMHECNMKRTFQGCSTLEAIALDAWSDINLSPGEAAFEGCTNLKRIIGTFCSFYRNENLSNIFKKCRALQEVRFFSDTSFSFADSPLLSRASVSETLRRAGTNAITITVHADVYAKLTGDTTNAAAAALTAEELAAWQQIVADAAEKNIAFATI